MSDDARKEYIISRLYDINVERMKMGGRLPVELAEERQQLINWWYQIEKKRYDEFIRTAGRDESI